MARNRFRQLKRFFHVVDNTQLKAGDKMGKIQPFYDEISKCFRQFGVFNEKPQYRRVNGALLWPPLVQNVHSW
ncbi:hypothetical protein MRX96_042179 [Rhipicephalus microplus]